MLRFLKFAGPIAVVTCLLPVLAINAQQPPPSATAQPAAKAVAKVETTKSSTDPIERIKEEGLKHSQVMATLSYLTDVIGPRLTGSPNMKRANEWTRDKLAAWGASDAHLEAWGPFGRGWSLKRFSAQVVEPQCIPLIGYPRAWSPGTDGTLEARVVYFDAKTEADFAAYKGKLKGAIVLTSPVREVAARWEPLANRKTDSELLALADAAEPAAWRWPPRRTSRRSRGPRRWWPRRCRCWRQRRPPADQPRAARFNSPEFRAQMELQRKKTQFLAEEGVAMLVDPSTQGDGGTFFVQSATVPGAPLPTPGAGPPRGECLRMIKMHPRSRPSSSWRWSTTIDWCGCASRARRSKWPSSFRFSSMTTT